MYLIYNFLGETTSTHNSPPLGRSFSSRNDNLALAFEEEPLQRRAHSFLNMANAVTFDNRVFITIGISLDNCLVRGAVAITHISSVHQIPLFQRTTPHLLASKRLHAVRGRPIVDVARWLMLFVPLFCMPQTYDPSFHAIGIQYKTYSGFHNLTPSWCQRKWQPAGHTKIDDPVSATCHHTTLIPPAETGQEEVLLQHLFNTTAQM